MLTQTERLLRWYALVLTILTLVAWSVSLIRIEILHWPADLGGLIYDSNYRFSDLQLFIPATRHPIGAGEAVERGKELFNLPAPAIFAYSFFALFGWRAPIALAVLLLGAVLLSARFLFVALMRRGVSPSLSALFLCLSVLTSYPLLFELDRANIEGVMWLLLIAAFFALVHERFYLSALLIALAGSIKPFPLVLLMIFLFMRRIRAVLIAGTVWLLVQFSAFTLSGPTFIRCFRAYRVGSVAYAHIVAGLYRPYQMNFDHSIFAAVKQGILLLYYQAGSPFSSLDPILWKLLWPYFLSAGLVCFVVLFCIRNKPVLNQILVCFLIMIIVPPANYDYTLVELYIPFSLFLLYLAESRCPAQMRTTLAIMLLCFAVVFTPQTYLRGQVLGVAGQMKLIALLGLFVLALRMPLSSSLDGLRVSRPAPGSSKPPGADPVRPQ